MKRSMSFPILVLLTSVLYSQTNPQKNDQQIELLIRCDDIGMSHSVNMALEEMIKTGLPFSASVMFPCSWYQEAVEILKSAPHVSVGIHLTTLNAEWKNYRWGPVLGN